MALNDKPEWLPLRRKTIGIYLDVRTGEPIRDYTGYLTDDIAMRILPAGAPQSIYETLWERFAPAEEAALHVLGQIVPEEVIKDALPSLEEVSQRVKEYLSKVKPEDGNAGN